MSLGDFVPPAPRFLGREAAGLAREQTPRLRAAVWFYKPWDSGGLFRPGRFPDPWEQWSPPHPPSSSGLPLAQPQPIQALSPPPPRLALRWCPARCVPTEGPSLTLSKMWEHPGGPVSRSEALVSPAQRLHSFIQAAVQAVEDSLQNQTMGLGSWLWDLGNGRPLCDMRTAGPSPRLGVSTSK